MEQAEQLDGNGKFRPAFPPRKAIFCSTFWICRVFMAKASGRFKMFSIRQIVCALPFLPESRPHASYGFSSWQCRIISSHTERVMEKGTFIALASPTPAAASPGCFGLDKGLDVVHGPGFWQWRWRHSQRPHALANRALLALIVKCAELIWCHGYPSLSVLYYVLFSKAASGNGYRTLEQVT
ncbi:hypothetical protein [Brevibacillus gelatini]